LGCHSHVVSCCWSSRDHYTDIQTSANVLMPWSRAWRKR